MDVKSRMVKKLITISKDTGIQEAIGLMRKHSVRHLPVVEDSKLIGLVTEGDLRQAFYPSLLDQVGVEEVMIKDPIKVNPNTRIEEAARLIHLHKIGGLPVVEGEKLVGIITITDILRAFIEMMGVLESSSRIDVILGSKPQAFEEVSRIIKTHQGEIISVGMSPLKGKTQKVHFFRLKKCNVELVSQALEKAGYRVVAAMS